MTSNKQSRWNASSSTSLLPSQVDSLVEPKPEAPGAEDAVEELITLHLFCVCFWQLAQVIRWQLYFPFGRHWQQSRWSAKQQLLQKAAVATPPASAKKGNLNQVGRHSCLFDTTWLTTESGEEQSDHKSSKWDVLKVDMNQKMRWPSSCTPNTVVSGCSLPYFSFWRMKLGCVEKWTKQMLDLMMHHGESQHHFWSFGSFWKWTKKDKWHFQPFICMRNG